MKKDIEWLKEELGELPCVDTVFNSDGSSYIYSAVPVMTVYGLINQLDEPEKRLEQEAVDELIEKYSKDEMSTHAVKVEREKFVEDLQNLLVPKQEKVVIPEFVAKWIEENQKYKNLMIIGYKYYQGDFGDSEFAKWVSENKDTFARAWLDGYTVEKEQKYYVMNNDQRMMLVRMMDGKTITEADPFKLEDMYEGEKKSHQLTEQEIKDYDPRYWAFRKPVEELEE